MVQAPSDARILKIVTFYLHYNNFNYANNITLIPHFPFCFMCAVKV